MRPLLAKDVLSVWERGQGKYPLEQALLVLSQACEEDWHSLVRLSLAERDARLWHLREMTFGTDLNSVATCPNCGENLEFSLDSRILAVEPVKEQTLEHEGFQIHYALPSSLGLAQVLHLEDDEAEEKLLQHCVKEVHKGKRKYKPENLPSEVLKTLQYHIDQLEEDAEVSLDLSCPNCQHQWQLPFDIAGFFWTELGSQAHRLLDEVHVLASRYHWAEMDILNLTEKRRKAYLELAL